jgi:GGDEF domain-containing protein
VPIAPFRPQPLRDAGLAAVLGMVIGIAVAVMREQLTAPFSALQKRSQIDSESSAFSRRHFQFLLERQVKDHPEEPLVLGLIQLMGLQDMSTLLPPLVIRQMLLHTANLLRMELRGNDVVARWNETAFAVLLPETSGKAGFRTLERVQKTMTVPIEIARSKITIALEPHIGLASLLPHEPAPEFLQRAVLALEETQQESGSTTIVLIEN